LVSYPASFGKILPAVDAIRRKREQPIPIPETRSAFHPRAQRMVSVAAMRGNNPDRSPVAIER
jgi:hypothetical protein